MNSESVDLIATDPPFNKNKDFHATPDSLAKGAKFQDRWSWKRDVQQEWVDQITDDYPQLMEAIESARYAHSDGMGAFMCFMAVRLMEMHRILKPKGSIYLHCDPTASHYLKACMDAIFGGQQFRNQIIWKRTAGAKLSQHEPKAWGRSGDVLLFYARTKAVRVRPYRKLTKDEADEKFEYVDTRGRYFTDGLTLFRRPSHGPRKNLCYEWRGFVNPHPSGWTLSKRRLEEEYRKGNVVITEDGDLERRKYEEDYPGAPARSIWTDIPNLTGKDAERTGFPTQKPLALYERIVAASSKEGDMVLDPFAGCATTCVAAERLGRQWAGIDIWDRAKAVVLERMQRERMALPAAERGDLFTADIIFTDEIPPRTDGGETAAPFLRVTERRQRPPLEPWQKLSRAQIVRELAEAQSVTEGLVLCAGCGRELEEPFMELDHITPRSDRGENDISNRILLCRPCNGRKSAKLTMKGLLAENRKAGWLKDKKRAEYARDLAHERYEQVRFHRPWPAVTGDLFGD